MTSAENLEATAWKDTKLVNLLRAQSNPVGDEKVNRKQCDKMYIQVPTVPAAIASNKNTGFVNLNNQLRNYHALGRKSRKCWRYLSWFLIDVSIINAHNLETEAAKSSFTFMHGLGVWMRSQYGVKAATSGAFTCGPSISPHTGIVNCYETK